MAPVKSKSKSMRKKQRKMGFIKNTQQVLSRDKRKKGTIDHNTRKYAAIAEASYKRGNNARLKQLNSRVTDGNFTIDDALSTKRMMVVDDGENVYVSFKGTDEASDLAPDLHIALGIQDHSKRFKQSNDDFQHVLSKYGDRKVILASHSLGGAINSYVYHNNKDRIHEVHNFNPGASPLYAGRGLNASANPMHGFAHSIAGLRGIFTHPDKKVHSHHIVGDPISMAGIMDKSHNTHVYRQVEGATNPHTIQNFLQ